MMLGGFVDLCGFVAAAMTLITFAQRTMLPMRVTARILHSVRLARTILPGAHPPRDPAAGEHNTAAPDREGVRQIDRLRWTHADTTDRRMACRACTGPISGGLFVDFEPLARLVRRRSQPSDGRVQPPQNARMDAVD